MPELAALPLEVRSAAYQELTPAERSAAWVTQLTNHRVPTLTAGQSAVLDAALVLAANPANFAGGPAAPEVAAIAGRGTAAFGVGPRAGNLRHPRSERRTGRHHGQAIGDVHGDGDHDDGREGDGVGVVPMLDGQ